MRKYMILIVLLTLFFSLITVVSAADVNETQELTDNTISQENEIISETASSTDVEKDSMSEGDDCCSSIVQNNDESVISFRRDSSATVTLNVTHNSSFVKQCKASGSYFFHVIVSKGGWLVGNGGTDSEQTILIIEANSLEMIKTNQISTKNMNAIINTKTDSIRGHYIIKAPNGTYSLFIKYNKNTFRKSGTLTTGDYLVVPNDPQYFKTVMSGSLILITFLIYPKYSQQKMHMV